MFANLLIFCFNALQGSYRWVTSCRTSISQKVRYHEKFILLKITCITMEGEINTNYLHYKY